MPLPRLNQHNHDTRALSDFVVVLFSLAVGFAGIVGHEFVGIVETAPPGHESLLGKRRQPEHLCFLRKARSDVRRIPPPLRFSRPSTIYLRDGVFFVGSILANNDSS